MRPGTASVRVIDLGFQGLLNPNPLITDEDEGLVDEYLSLAKLRILTGVEDLQEVTTLQMRVDTRENSLGNFGEDCSLGAYMPNLRQLKLNNSLILSVRDLGTSLSQLQVLWMAQCGLTDLDGIASFCSLKELYLAYNDLSDLSQMSMLEHLEILDLEGNCLDQIMELQYLALCNNLTTLTLEGNPICARPSPEATESPDYNYRAEVRNIIPQLRILDDAPAEQIIPASPNTPTHDWLMVRDYIKDNVGSQLEPGVGPVISMRKSNQRPATANPTLTRRPHSAPRPASAMRPVTSHQRAGGSPFTESSVEGAAEDEASDLTHGVGKVICGNPIKALRARREKLGAPVLPLQALGHRPEHTYDSEVLLGKDRDDVFSELRAWREKHNELLQRIKVESAPQILTITHTDEDSLCTSSEDEELNESWDPNGLERVSPENASPLPRSPTGHNVFQGATLVPSPPVTPCPPASTSENPRLKKVADIRVRRLLRGPSQHGNKEPRPMPTDTYIGDEAFPLTDIDGDSSGIVVSLRAPRAGCSEQARATSESARTGPNNSRLPLDQKSPKVIPAHQPVIRSSTKSPDGPFPPHNTRPITTKGVLQRLPNRPNLLMVNKTSS
ncbi:leucine-rich repeat-containing protein 56 [Rhinophrynus dorsalis]